MNFKIESVDMSDPYSAKGNFHSYEVSDARQVGARMVQWTPVHSAIPVEIFLVTGEILQGVSEPEIKSVKPGQMIQFERFGFCRVEEIGSMIKLIWTHN